MNRGWQARRGAIQNYKAVQIQAGACYARSARRCGVREWSAGKALRQEERQVERWCVMAVANAGNHSGSQAGKPETAAAGRR